VAQGKVINVTTFFDKNVEFQAAVLIRNLARLATADRPVRFFIFTLGDGFSINFDDEASVMESPAFSLVVNKLQNVMDFMPERCSNLATAFRLLVGEMLPHLERVIYIDIDVLIMQNLAELYDMNLGAKTIGAVRGYKVMKAREANANLGLSGIALQLPAQKYFDEIIGMQGKFYFNAGVLLIDLNRWRAEKVKEKSLDFFDRNVLLLFTDQDALNHVLRDQVLFLEEDWNFIPSKNRPITKNTRVIHFAGRKPWEAAYDCDDVEVAEREYWKSALKTPYGLVLLDKFYSELSLGVSQIYWSDFKIPTEYRARRRKIEGLMPDWILRRMGELLSTIGLHAKLEAASDAGYRLQSLASRRS
jgi:lipopolysaccharide biosynthesis glycosyltransferase